MVVWWVALVTLAAAGLPLAALLLRPLPDRGAGFALPAALAVLFVPVYWLGHVRFGPLTAAVGALVLAGASILASRRGPTPHVRRFAEVLGVFTLAFLFVVAIRAVDPSAHPGGGEKYLDYGMLKSLLRGTTLPPEDVWFAGEPVSYYYGGHMLSATLATLTATPARYAYNLALAGFYGMVVAAAYGLAGSIAESRGHSYRLAGGLGAFFVGIASNLVPPLQAVLIALPDDVALPIARWIAERTALGVEEISSADAFSYWTASRVIPGTVNEFPLFAWLNGDLHAHMMSTSFLLLVAGVGLAYFLTPAGSIRRRRLLVYGAVPPLAGMLAVTNTWSFPSAVGVTALAVLFADAPPRDLLPAAVARRLPGDVHRGASGAPDGGLASLASASASDGLRAELSRLASAVAVAVGVAVLAVLWVLPFVLGPATGADRSIALVADRSDLLGLLLHHGWFLGIYGAYLLSRFDPADGWRLPVAAVVAGLVVLTLAVDLAVLAAVLPLLALAWYLLRREAGVGYESVLFVAGAGLVIVVDLVFVVEEAGPGRFNTVFKTYAQVWILWATGAAAALVGVLPRPGRALAARARSAGATGRGSTTALTPRRWLAWGLAALLVVSLSFYGGATLASHFGDPVQPEPTLDATMDAQIYHPAEWEAIQYLDGLPGQPNMASAPACWCNPRDSGVLPYRWANGPASLSGVPTLAGWGHEAGYRGSEVYMERVRDVETIYTGSREERVALLRQYDVEYIYVGPNERTLYGDPDFDGAPELSVAFQNDQVTIYAVDLQNSS